MKNPLIRINSRIEKNQHQFIKDEAKKNGLTEGEVLRSIIDYYIKKNK